jgi:hypothetical protein
MISEKKRERTRTSNNRRRLRCRELNVRQGTCGNFSDTSSLKFLKTKGSIGHAFTVCIHTENQNQRSFYPFVLHEISVLIELLLGHLCYRLTDVPPQPNSPNHRSITSIYTRRWTLLLYNAAAMLCIAHSTSSYSFSSLSSLVSSFLALFNTVGKGLIKVKS